MGAFLAESSLDDISNLLNILEPLFGAQGKEIKSVPSDLDDNVPASPSKSSVKIPKSSCASLASSAIAGWSLLITVMPSEFLMKRASK